jgi:phage baseplate assembly protein gpV
MPRLDRIVAQLAGELHRTLSRVSKMRRPGVVSHYDPQKHMARACLNTGDEEPFLTPWSRIDEASGSHTSRTTLTVGQTVWVNCPNGDIRGCTISAGAYSDDYKSSSQAAEETRFERDDVRVAIRPDGGELSMGDVQLTVSKGKAQMKIGNEFVKIEEGKISTFTAGTASFD